MKRVLALAAVLSVIGGSAMADCLGHVSAAAPAPQPADGQVSTSPGSAGSTADAAGTVTAEGAVLSARTDAAPSSSTVPEQE